MPGDRRIAVSLFVLSLVSYAWFFGGAGWNASASFDLTRALVERGTLYIDGYHTNSGDVSWSGGHVYINKSPGLSVLGAIPYSAIYGIERLFGIPPDDWRTLTINLYLVTVLTSGVCGALIPAVIYLYARRRCNASPLTAVSVALAIAFGTIVFPYSTIFFAHVPSALFLLLAFVWLDDRPRLAGAAAGIAGACFYFCIPAVLVLAIAKGKKALPFIAGGVPFAIALAIYQWACFGSPWTMPLERSTDFTERGLLFGVLRGPSKDALWGLTFAESHGLFFSAPVLLLAIVGAVMMIRRRVMIRELVLVGTIFVLMFVITASFNGWHGGLAFGPRYLLSFIPLLAIPMLFAPWRALFFVLTLLSAFLQFLAAAVNPMPPSVTSRPVREFLLPAFFTGRVPIEVAHGIGSPWEEVGHVAINPQSVDEYCAHCTHAPGSRASIWSSFNLGEFLFGAQRSASVIPIVLWMIAGSVALLRSLAPSRAAHS